MDGWISPMVISLLVISPLVHRFMYYFITRAVYVQQHFQGPKCTYIHIENLYLENEIRRNYIIYCNLYYFVIPIKKEIFLPSH